MSFRTNLVRARGHIVFLVALVIGLLLVLWLARASEATPAAEKQALVALYEATNGAGWTGNSGWDLSGEPCTGSTPNWNSNPSSPYAGYGVDGARAYGANDGARTRGHT